MSELASESNDTGRPRAAAPSLRGAVGSIYAAMNYAELSLGTSKIMVSGPREPGWLGGAAPLASPISLYAVVDDPVVREPEHTDYGSHEYSARDPEGNLWSFGTYQP